jgi:VWFA-related protein
MGPPSCPARLLSVFALAAGILAAPILLRAQAKQHALYVSVTDRAGQPVGGLGPSDFVVREDNVSREILSAVLADDPMQIALLVDNSQASEPYIRDYRQALAAFITTVAADTSVKAKHQIALITLASRPTIVKDYSSDHAQVLKSAQSVFSMPETGTLLLDGIIETSQGMNKRHTPRPVFVAVVTEGPELSNRAYDDVLRALKESGAALHILKVGRPSNMAGDRAMVIDRGTRTTGGHNEDILTSSGLTATMTKLAADLTHQYRVVYARPERLIPPDAIAVSVTKPGLTARGTVVKEERAQERK